VRIPSPPSGRVPTEEHTSRFDSFPPDNSGRPRGRGPVPVGRGFHRSSISRDRQAPLGKQQSRSVQTGESPGANPGRSIGGRPGAVSGPPAKRCVQPKAVCGASPPPSVKSSSRSPADQDAGVRSRRAQVRILPGACPWVRSSTDEQPVENRNVDGATPSGPISIQDGRVAQPEERLSHTEKAAGATPAAPIRLRLPSKLPFRRTPCPQQP
jgi:hypothetical protein